MNILNVPFYFILNNINITYGGLLGLMWPIWKRSHIWFFQIFILQQEMLIGDTWNWSRPFY